MKNLLILIFATIGIIANSLYAATWEDFKANAKYANFVYQHFYYDGGSIGYEFEYIDKLSGTPQTLFIIDQKSKFTPPDLRSIYVDIGTLGKRFGDNGFEVKSEADKAFLIDFLLRFSQYEEIFDTLKFLGKEPETAPSKKTPEEMDARTGKLVEELIAKKKEDSARQNRYIEAKH